MLVSIISIFGAIHPPLCYTSQIWSVCCECGHGHVKYTVFAWNITSLNILKLIVHHIINLIKNSLSWMRFKLMMSFVAPPSLSHSVKMPFKTTFNRYVKHTLALNGLKTLIFWQPTSARYTKKVHAIKEPWKQIWVASSRDCLLKVFFFFLVGVYSLT